MVAVNVSLMITTKKSILERQNKKRNDSNLPIETTIKPHREVAGESERITMAVKQAVNSFNRATLSPYLSELTLTLSRLDSLIKRIWNVLV